MTHLFSLQVVELCLEEGAGPNAVKVKFLFTIGILSECFLNKCC